MDRMDVQKATDVNISSHSIRPFILTAFVNTQCPARKPDGF
jgi:hypothetical protein